MPKAAKGTKTVKCAACQEIKLACHFTHNALTCKECVVGKDRPCCGCGVPRKAAEFADGQKRNCSDCNKHKDTAEHVDVCIVPGCDTAFSRNPDTFIWKKRGDKGNWESKCRTCTNKKRPVPEDAPDRQCSKCSKLKPAQGFHGAECSDCRSDRTKKQRQINCAAADPATARQKPCTKRGCGRPFSQDMFKWQGDRWSSWCRPCHNSAGYYKAYRTRRLVNDSTSYRQHNNDVLRAWRASHPENQARHKLRQKTNVECVWQRWLLQAKNRGITVALDEKDDLQEMFLQPCHYCGFLPQPGHAFNTLDRVDSNVKHYSLSTSVTCCVPCNRLKASKKLEDFLLEAADKMRSSGNDDFDENMNRQQIDAAHRSLGLQNPELRSDELFCHQQMCFIARHCGLAD